MKKTILALLVLVSFEAPAFEVKEKYYHLIKGDESLCSSGPARIIKDEGEETFTLATIISIPLIKKETREKVADGQCLQVDQLVRSENKLIFTSVTKECSQKFKKLERRVVQFVTIEGDKLTYKIVTGSSSKECLFKEGEK